jgi:hypothetical protein
MGSAYNCGTQKATLVKNEKQKTQPVAEADFIKGNSQVLLMFSILPVEKGRISWESQDGLIYFGGILADLGGGDLLPREDGRGLGEIIGKRTYKPIRIVGGFGN